MIEFYDTPQRRKRRFEPLQPGIVRMYSCGPTVWDYAHIGNFRSFLFVDVLKRYLRYRGYEVEHVMNLTDVDDRIVQQVNGRAVSLEQYVGPYIEGFFDDLDALGIQRADRYPRATEHVAEMVRLVERLVERGAAYEREGSVYYSIASFPTYGEFAHLDRSGMRHTARVDSDRYDKDDVRDFVLWKARTETDGDVFWDSPWGRGRPGWHLECSSMSMEYLGETFDIHTGGVDLVFPHHQNEIAQSEGATGRPFARYWMHNEFVHIDGVGMSKSLGNNLRLRDIRDSDQDVAGFRYLAVTSHYRTVLNFTREALDGARRARQRLNRLYGKVRRTAAGAPQPDADVRWVGAVNEARQGFQAAMDDDLNSPRAMAAVFGLVGSAEKAVAAGELNPGSAGALADFLEEVDSVLGILDRGGDSAEETGKTPPLPDELARKVAERQQAREARDWSRADRLRLELAEAGVTVTDTPGGPTWTWAPQEGSANSFRDNE